MYFDLKENQKIHNLNGVDAAIEHCELFLRQVSKVENIHSVYYRLGGLYLKAGDKERAKIHYLRSYDYNPDGWGMLSVALGLIECDEERQCLIFFEDIESVHPEQAVNDKYLVCLIRAWCFKIEKNWEMALKWVEEIENEHAFFLKGNLVYPNVLASEIRSNLKTL